MQGPAINRFRRRLTFRLAMFAMLVNLISPAGFMPADLSGGHWLMVCPDGLPSGLIDTGHHDHGRTGHDADDRQMQFGLDQCPIGAAVSAPSIISQHDSVAFATIRELVAELPRLPARKPCRISALARAPPATIFS